MNTEILLVVTMATKQQIGLIWMGIIAAAGLAFFSGWALHEVMNSATEGGGKSKKEDENLPMGIGKGANPKRVKPGEKAGFAPPASINPGDKIMQIGPGGKGEALVKVIKRDKVSVKKCIKIFLKGVTYFETSPSTYFMVYIKGEGDAWRKGSELEVGMMLGGKEIEKIEVIEKETDVYRFQVEGQKVIKSLLAMVGDTTIAFFAQPSMEDIAPPVKNGNGKNGGGKSDSKRPAPTDRRRGRR